MAVLGTVQRGRKMKPLAVMVYAPHGLGKTNFALDAPNPVYVGKEESDEYDMARFPKVVTWAQLLDQLRALRDDQHDFRTCVIDTTDSLEQVAQSAILVGDNAKKTMATAFGGYGKAYEKMADMFLDLRDNYLVPMRDNRGMNIVLLTHADKVKHEDPMTQTSYDHYTPAHHKKVRPILEDWVSAIFFINYYLVRAENASGKEFAQGANGLRMIYTEERPSHVAKNRFGLPYEIEYQQRGTWKVIRDLVVEHFSKGPKQEAPAGKTNVAAEQPQQTAPTAPSAPESPPAKESGPGKTGTASPANTTRGQERPPSGDAQTAAPSGTGHAGPQLPANDPEYLELSRAIDELMVKVPESSKASIGTAVARAGRDVKELQRIYNKMQTLTK